MSILVFIFFGLIVGFLARAIMPCKQPMGWLATAGLGVAGAFFGGFLTSLVSDQRVFDLHTAGLVGSVVGAIAVLVLARIMIGGRAFA